MEEEDEDGANLDDNHDEPQEKSHGASDIPSVVGHWQWILSDVWSSLQLQHPN